MKSLTLVSLLLALTYVHTHAPLYTYRVSIGFVKIFELEILITYNITITEKLEKWVPQFCLYLGLQPKWLNILECMLIPLGEIGIFILSPKLTVLSLRPILQQVDFLENDFKDFVQIL